MKDTVKIIDDDLGVASFVTITKDDITAKGKLRPMGARHFAARSQLMQNLNGIHNGPIGQLIDPHTSRIGIAKLVEETMGLTKYALYRDNIGVTEQADTQRLVNEAQQGVDNAQTAPLDENLV